MARGVAATRVQCEFALLACAAVQHGNDNAVAATSTRLQPACAAVCQGEMAHSQNRTAFAAQRAANARAVCRVDEGIKLVLRITPMRLTEGYSSGMSQLRSTLRKIDSACNNRKKCLQRSRPPIYRSGAESDQSRRKTQVGCLDSRGTRARRDRTTHTPYSLTPSTPHLVILLQVFLQVRTGRERGNNNLTACPRRPRGSP